MIVGENKFSIIHWWQEVDLSISKAICLILKGSHSFNFWKINDFLVPLKTLLILKQNSNFYVCTNSNKFKCLVGRIFLKRIALIKKGSMTLPLSNYLITIVCEINRFYDYYLLLFTCLQMRQARLFN